jgi:hypothetical protein
MKFNVSIWAKGNGFSVYPINTVMGALVFLDNWPPEPRGSLFDAATDALRAARKGQITNDEARRALVAFLHEADALAEETSIG